MTMIALTAHAGLSFSIFLGIKQEKENSELTNWQ